MMIKKLTYLYLIPILIYFTLISTFYWRLDNLLLAYISTFLLAIYFLIISIQSKKKFISSLLVIFLFIEIFYGYKIIELCDWDMVCDFE